MFELMKQIKICVQNNSNEARQMLLQNPQLAYTLLQAQVVMRMVDPHTAITMLKKANLIPPLLLPNDKSSTLHNIPPPRIEEPWATINRPPPVINPPTSIFAGKDVDLRTLDRQMEPRLARMDQDLRTQPVIQPAPVVSPVVNNRAAFSLPDKFLPTLPSVLPVDGFESPFCRDPRADKFGRDPRMPVDSRMNKINPTPRPVAAPVVAPIVPNTMFEN